MALRPMTYELWILTLTLFLRFTYWLAAGEWIQEFVYHKTYFELVQTWPSLYTGQATGLTSAVVWSNLFQYPNLSSCMDNNLDTTCLTPAGVSYPYVLLYYAQPIIIYNVSVILRWNYFHMRLENGEYYSLTLLFTR